LYFNPPIFYLNSEYQNSEIIAIAKDGKLALSLGFHKDLGAVVQFFHLFSLPEISSPFTLQLLA